MESGAIPEVGSNSAQPSEQMKELRHSHSFESHAHDIEDIVTRCHVLLAELRIYGKYCEQKKYMTDYRQRVEYAHFLSDIKQCVKRIEKIKETNGSPEHGHQLNFTSSLAHWEAIWNTAKQSKDLLTLGRHNALTDIVADAGLTWIKVSTTSEKRLVMELAKQGWKWIGTSDGESEDDNLDVPNMDADMDISMVKAAIKLCELAKGTRIKYQQPHVHFVFTRIRSGNKDIDAVLDQIRATGATVTTAEQMHSAPPIEEVLENLVIDERKFFSSTLNLDINILLAIVSDISHDQVQEELWFNDKIRAHIQIEERNHLMVNSLWPVLVEHDLVSTKLAVQRAREIIEFIGTERERARFTILIGDYSSKSPKELLGDFQLLSMYTVPSKWRIPVRVVEDPLPEQYPSLLTSTLAKELGDLNGSVFIYGWIAALTTITSNRMAVKAIERMVGANRKNEHEMGPGYWVCGTSRCLVAKERDKEFWVEYTRME